MNPVRISQPWALDPGHDRFHLVPPASRFIYLDLFTNHPISIASMHMSRLFFSAFALANAWAAATSSGHIHRHPIYKPPN